MNADRRPALATAAVGVVLCLAGAAVLVVLLPAAFGHTERTETAVFAASLLAALPASLWLAPRVTPGLRAAIGEQRVIAAAALLVLAGLPAFLPRHLLDLGSIVAVLALAAALLAALLALRRIRLERRWQLAADIAAGAAIFLVVADVGGYLHPSVAQDGAALFAYRLHNSPFVSPAASVMHGREMLVETFSLYGVGVFYFLAGYFEWVGLGYGAFALLTAALTAMQHVVAYAALRVAGVSAALAAVGLAVGVVAGVLAADASPTFVPSTGALRYGLAYALILVCVIGAARGATARWPALGLLALASVWSVDAFVSAALVLAAVAAIDALLLDARPRARLRRFGEWALWAVALCIAAQAVLAFVTRAAGGAWPDWGGYVDILSPLLDSDFGFLELAADRSAGLVLGAVLLASVAGLWTLARVAPDLLRARRPAAVAIAGFTAVGLVQLYYFTGRSVEGALPYFLLPAAALACAWISLAVERRAVRPLVAAAVLAPACVLAAVLVTNDWDRVESTWSRTALAKLLPGSGTLPSSLSDLGASPPFTPESPEGERLLQREFPGDTALVIAAPEVGHEILVRADKVNVLPSTDPLVETHAADLIEPRSDEALDGLRPGRLLLTDENALRSGAGLFPFQRRALDRLRRRFDLVRRTSSPSGLVVVELTPRTSTAPAPARRSTTGR